VSGENQTQVSCDRRLAWLTRFYRVATHVLGTVFALLAFFQTDPEFMSLFTPRGQTYLRLVVAGAVYLGWVLVVPTAPPKQEGK